MPNVVAIIKDDRVRRQTEQFLQQLEMDDLRFYTFKTHQEFTALYFKNLVNPGSAGSAEKLPELEDMKVFSEVNIVIFALDSIGEKSGPWIDKLKTNFKKFKHWPANQPTRLVMLKYEDDGISKLDVLHPLLDDLIYLPLDRLVFMQKMEILLNLPNRVKPRYLFNQEVKQDIEISKITKLDRLSDVGLAMRNPVPLKKGLTGHFYVTLTGEKNRLEVRGKVFRSEPHPEYPGQYLVYFNYFGLSKNDLTMIRRSLARAPRYQSLFNDDHSLFRYRPGDLFLKPNDSRSYGVAVIDPDSNLTANLASQLGKDMDRLKATGENSYTYFLQKYFEPTGTINEDPPDVTSPSDFYKSPLTLNISTRDMKCLSLDPGPEAGDLILGHAAMDIFANPDRWLTLFKEKGSRQVLEEGIKFAETGTASEKLIILEDRDGRRRAVNFRFKKGAADHLITAEIVPASLGDIAGKMKGQERTKELDVIIINSGFVPDDPQGWILGLRTRAVHVGLVQDPSTLKFILISDFEENVNEAWLNCPDILGMFAKPIDNRGLLFLLSEALANKNTVYHFENLGWAQPNVPLHVSKKVELHALSEFGVTLKAAQKLMPGTMIYLRKSIYDNAPNQCLAARVYACEDIPGEKGNFYIYATYFGINDAFLKFARTWIREHYAQQKALG